MRLLKRIHRASVWGPAGVDAHDWRFRNLYRVVFPYVDLMFIWFGVVGWVNGIQTVQDAAGDSWQTGWSALIAVCATLALAGVSFPRLWALELIGKIPLIGLVSAYLAVFVARGVEDPKVAATAGVLTILIAFPIWRVGDITVHDLRPWAARQRGER